MMTDGGKDPQSNQNSDAPFQTGAQDNEAPPGTPAGASPPAFSGSSWSPFYSPVHGGYAGLPAAPDAAQAGSADAGEPQEVDDNELQTAAQDGGPAVEGGGLTADRQVQDTTISEAASLDAVAPKPDDYYEANDPAVVKVYQSLKGDIPKPNMLNVSRYRLTPQGYLLHLDPVTNQMATVIPTAKAQQELVRAFHLDWGRHPHAHEQVHIMRHLCML